MAASDMLTALETAIQARLEGGAVDSYMVADKNLKYMSLTEMFKLRTQLKAEVNQAQGPHTNYIEFTRP